MSPRDGGLRIAEVAPVASPVRPGQRDSVEQLVAHLTEGLVARGHDVTLYATANSRTSANLRAIYPRGYDEEDDYWDWYRAESFNVAQAIRYAADHDVIHAHNFNFALPFAPFAQAPLVDTPHTEISPEVIGAYRQHPEVQVVAVSEYQRRLLAEVPNVTVIPHGVPFETFPFGDGAGGYLLFLGRMLADKGPAQAIQIARATRMPLILAGPAQDGYDVRSEPDLDGERIRWVGSVTPGVRNSLLAGAVALLFPLVYPEPFGLVLLEAMACGTPVLGTELGAVPEIVENGVTGFTARTWEGLPDLVAAAGTLDRKLVRAKAADRFDIRRMIDRHEALYRQLVEERR